MNVRILTGGQTGVDTGALLGARIAGAKWAALLPWNWRREKLIPLWMADHAKALPLVQYEERTKYCVENADAVLIIAPSMKTPGTRLTRDFADEIGKPRWWHEPGVTSYEHTLNWLRQIAAYNAPTTLMVAGPRESKWKDGEGEASRLVAWLLDMSASLPAVRAVEAE